mmetsp:Transcript_9729/g.29680  ORF Transcript_9729/g.29680 Transcript_9729/m.29680 type:complete len:270 (+) Transcript_9729:1102-1911(+)
MGFRTGWHLKSSQPASTPSYLCLRLMVSSAVLRRRSCRPRFPRPAASRQVRVSSMLMRAANYACGSCRRLRTPQPRLRSPLPHAQPRQQPPPPPLPPPLGQGHPSVALPPWPKKLRAPRPHEASLQPHAWPPGAAHSQLERPMRVVHAAPPAPPPHGKLRLEPAQARCVPRSTRRSSFRWSPLPAPVSHAAQPPHVRPPRLQLPTVRRSPAGATPLAVPLPLPHVQSPALEWRRPPRRLQSAHDWRPRLPRPLPFALAPPRPVSLFRAR